MLTFIRLVSVGDVRPFRIDTRVVAVMMQRRADLIPYEYEHQHPAHKPKRAACCCSVSGPELRMLHAYGIQRYLVIALNSEV